MISTLMFIAVLFASFFAVCVVGLFLYACVAALLDLIGGVYGWYVRRFIL